MIALTMRAAAVALLFGASGALAQQPARPPAPAAPNAAAPTPSHLAAARDLALLLKIDDPITIVLNEMQAQVVRSFTTTRPELTKDLTDVLLAMNPQIAAKREEIIIVGANAFAKRFTEPEITELMTFLKTPLGQKYIRAQPDAFNEYLQQVRAWIGDMNDFVVATVRAEMKKKGHDL